MIHVITQPGLTSFEVTLFFCVCLSTYLNSNNKIRKQQQKKNSNKITKNKEGKTKTNNEILLIKEKNKIIIQIQSYWASNKYR